MAQGKGIQHHPLYKLGKAGARRDPRNLKFAAILRAPIKLPREYDFDLKHPGIPTPMFGNDRLGDCVIAGRAHQTLRFELIEAKARLKISDSEVVKEYLRETGGADTGLVVLDSLRAWRRRGWTAAKRNYKVHAFSELNRANHNQLKQAIVLDVGVGIGLALPLTAQTQFQTGKAWDVVSGRGSKPNSWGGHYVYLSGYTAAGPVCVTWGRKQQMTWAFFDKYCDEAYAIIDAIDTAQKKKALDALKVRDFLRKLA